MTLRILSKQPLVLLPFECYNADSSHTNCNYWPTVFVLPKKDVPYNNNNNLKFITLLSMQIWSKISPPHLPITASPQWPLFFVPKMAIVERFDCIWILGTGSSSYNTVNWPPVFVHTWLMSSKAPLKLFFISRNLACNERVHVSEKWSPQVLKLSYENVWHRATFETCCVIRDFWNFVKHD